MGVFCLTCANILFVPLCGDKTSAFGGSYRVTMEISSFCSSNLRFHMWKSDHVLIFSALPS